MLSYWVASLTHPVPDSAKLLKELGQSVPEELLRRKKERAGRVGIFMP